MVPFSLLKTYLHIHKHADTQSHTLTHTHKVWSLFSVHLYWIVIDIASTLEKMGFPLYYSKSIAKSFLVKGGSLYPFPSLLVREPISDLKLCRTQESLEENIARILPIYIFAQPEVRLHFCVKFQYFPDFHLKCLLIRSLFVQEVSKC